MNNLKTETAYNYRHFPYLNVSLQKIKKHVFFEGKPEVRKLPTIVSSVCIWILASKTPKNMPFIMENPNTETAYNCRQFPYLNLACKAPKSMYFEKKNPITEFCIWFSQQKTKKHALCNGKPENGNFLQS